MSQPKAEKPAEVARLCKETANIAYIRPVHDLGIVLYAIHTAEGQPLALAPTRALAFAAVHQHGLEPVDAH